MKMARCPAQLALLISMQVFTLRQIKKGRTRRPFYLVEMAGVEPASEDQLPRLSTSVADLLKFPQCSAERQALHLGSL